MIRRGAAPVDRFTIVPNDHLRDTRLSWAARGMLAWLMSHMAGFEVTEAGLIAAGPVGRDGVRAIIRELEKHGYLKRERVPILSGGSTVDYVLTDPRATEIPPLGDDGISVARPDQAFHLSSADKPAAQGAPPPSDGNPVARSYEEDEKKTNTKTSSSLRATRVPDDFMPDEKMRDWFVGEQLGAVINGKVEHEKFMDYWRACPGARGRKLDWPATWRNWMRTAAERSGRQPGNALVPTSGAPMQYKPSTTDQKVAQTLELGRRLQAMEDAK